MPSTPINLSHAFLGLFSWMTFIAVFQFVLLPTLTNRFRQRIFYLRREMFLLLLKTPIAPHEPAYTHLRSTMNGVLRFAERITFTRLLIHGIVFREQTQAYAKKLQADLARIPNPALREQLIIFRSKLGHAIIRHVLTISPMAWMLLLVVSPFLFVLFLFRGFQSLAQLGRRSIILLAEHLSVQGIEAQAEALVVRE